MSSVVSTAVDVADDPYLPEVICRAGQLHQIEVGQPVQACATTASGLTGGIGMRKIIQPLRAFVYAEQHRWVYPLAAAVIFGLPLAIGYTLGKD